MPDQAPQMPVDIMPLLAAAAGIVLLLVLVRAIQRALRRRRRFRDRIEPTLAIDVSQLSQQGPPATGPLLTFYHLPVRLAAIILAPAGRAGTLPAAEGMPQLLDAIVPGLAEVVAAHDPLRLRWPEQLSASGFAHSFFIHARLPGEAGKGTPWASVAGLAKTHKGSAMVAMIVRAERPNSYGQQIIETEGDWLRVFQVRPA